MDTDERQQTTAQTSHQEQPNYSEENARTEQRKSSNILIAIIGSGLFITIIIVAGLLLFYSPPDSAESSVVEQNIAPQRFDPIEYLREGSGDLEAPLVGVDAPSDRTAEDGTQTTDDRVVFISPGASTPQIEQQSAKSDAPPAAPAPRIHTQQKKATPPRRADTATKPPAAAPPSTSVAHSQAPASSIQRRNLYWIQVFSSPERDSAEQAYRRLAEHQIDGVISRLEDSRGVFYQLRVGPFTDIREANKFLNWFEATDSYRDSFVVTVSNQ